MGKKTVDCNQIVDVLKKLKEQYPNQNLGRHLSIATSDYQDLFNLSDKELLFALEKYAAELECDITPTKTLENIVNDIYNDIPEDDWEDDEE